MLVPDEELETRAGHEIVEFKNKTSSYFGSLVTAFAPAPLT